jgi:GNAT superfamily N-acetyltransferase
MGRELAGFTISILHEGSWTTRPCCYLEDLFVDPSFRGRGIARALIEDLVQRCPTQGWSRLYWHTRNSNREARRLYDKFVRADDFVRYRMILESPRKDGRRRSCRRPFLASEGKSI